MTEGLLVGGSEADGGGEGKQGKGGEQREGKREITMNYKYHILENIFLCL